MKMRGMIIVALSLLLFSAGCHKVTTDDNTKPVETTQQTIDYTQLSDSEKSEMTFEFVRKDNANLSTVNLKVINRTSKNIKFNGNKFVLIHPREVAVTDVTSTFGKEITVKSNSTKTIRNLFDNVDSRDFEVIGLYCYKSKADQLAFNEANTLSSKSTNLKDADLQKAYKKADKKQQQPKKAPATTRDQNQPNKQTQIQAPTGPITNASQAVALIQSQYGAALSGTAYSHMEDETSDPSGSIALSNGQRVYWVRLARTDVSAGGDLDDWTVYPDRTVLHRAPGDLDSNTNNNDNDSNDDEDDDGSYDESDDNETYDYDFNDDYDADDYN